MLIACFTNECGDTCNHHGELHSQQPGLGSLAHGAQKGLREALRENSSSALQVFARSFCQARGETQEQALKCWAASLAVLIRAGGADAGMEGEKRQEGSRQKHVRQTMRPFHCCCGGSTTPAAPSVQTASDSPSHALPALHYSSFLG